MGRPCWCQSGIVSGQNDSMRGIRSPSRWLSARLTRSREVSETGWFILALLCCDDPGIVASHDPVAGRNGQELLIVPPAVDQALYETQIAAHLFKPPAAPRRLFR